MLALVADGQLPTPFCPPARQDLPTILRLHPRTETMGVSPSTFARLERTFHDALAPQVAIRTTDKKRGSRMSPEINK